MSILRAAARQLVHRSPAAEIVRQFGLGPRSVPFPPPAGAPTEPFVVCLTVDTEPGYLRDDLECVWADREPRAWQGFSFGVPAMLELARQRGVPVTFLATSQAFLAQGDDHSRIRTSFERLLAAGHELGLHLHPRTDESLHRELGQRLEHASAHFYSESEQARMLDASRELFARGLGRDVAQRLTSFRWGNWALGSASVRALEACGFQVDSSALPGKRGHEGSDRFFDWSRLQSRAPFRMCRADYQDATTQDAELLELPTATCRWLGGRVLDATWGPLLDGVVERCHADADRSHRPFVLVVSLHSPELVFADGRAAPTLAAVEHLIVVCQRLPGVRFATLREAAAVFSARAR